MRSQPITLTNLILVFTLAVVTGSGVVWAQDKTVPEQQPDSDEALLREAEKDIQYMRLGSNYAFKAERRLKELLRRYPNSPLRPQAEEGLYAVNETLGEHSLAIALFYLNKFEKGKSKSLKGAEGRLRHIVCQYPSFSQMDEVLLHLVRLYSLEEDAREAMQFLQEFIHKHPRDREFKDACEGLKRL